MNALAPSIKGWCPSALRPMPTGDGLLARVRVSAGRLTLDQAEAVAAAARDCGNGTIEISSRANLQLRGVDQAPLIELQTRLANAGLMDADPESERMRVRNIVASPLSDLDPEAALDVGPVAAALEARLAADAELRDLPGKFGFVIDAGGRWPLRDVEADVRFEAFVAAEGVQFAVRLNEPQPLPVKNGEGSSPHLAPPRSYGEVSGVGLAAACAPEQVPDVAACLARAFLTLAGHGDDAPRRMRALVWREGASKLFAAAGLATTAEIGTAKTAAPRDSVGVIQLGEHVGLGAAPQFGRVQAAPFAELARAARASGATGLRLTPWRTCIAIGLEEARARVLARQLAALGFIVARDDPRLAIVACPGAPACAHGNRDTTADARRFAASLPRVGGIVLHVSGCAKGCARAAPALLTLVATSSGYDLVVDGRANGAPLHRGLSLDQAHALVVQLGQGLAA